MTLGPILFLSPWLLLGLAALPAIWWLLRATPPRPQVVRFPPTRLLLDLINRERTPKRTPWWLTLLRMLAAALVILALSQPVLRPSQARLAGNGPVVLMIDNGWAAAKNWPQRAQMFEGLIARAEVQSRPLLVVTTADEGGLNSLQMVEPAAARDRIAILKPLPYPPNRMAALAAAKKALGEARGISVFWLSDGLDYGKAGEFARGLTALAGNSGEVTAVTYETRETAVGLRKSSSQGEKLGVELIRVGGDARGGTVLAWSSRGQRLGESSFAFVGGAKRAKAEFAMPLELRNQVARVEIEGERTAGAVHLLDARSRWHRIGLLAGSSREDDQPLLSPLHYIERAIKPFGRIVKSHESNMASAIDELLGRKVSVLALADIGKLVGSANERLTGWVEKGGVLVRFAGPRLEKAEDTLLPVKLRFGGRTLGGALSWSKPQELAPFDDSSLFSGLKIPKDVAVKRQVLADPAQLTAETKIWARLRDGTPLVTAAKRGKGWVVLFHVTANSDWSDLPLSGLFVAMLRRILTISNLSGVGDGKPGATSAAGKTGRVDEKGGQVLAPLQTLNGFGQLGAPAPTAQPVALAKLDSAPVSAANPPGLYGPASSPRAVNLIRAKTELKGLPPLPSAISRLGYAEGDSRHLKPGMLLAALLLVFLDVLAILALQMGSVLRRRPAAAAKAAILVAAFCTGAAVLAGAGGPALAQTGADGAKKHTDKKFALMASLKTRLAYVVTGDDETDRTSRLGLSGLSKILRARTAVEPGEPVGLNVHTDELAFFPILYWPVLPDAPALPKATLAKIDAYMKSGGMVIFDTRDYSQRAAPELGGEVAGTRALQRLIGGLDLPRLEPVPDKHVLTRSFYLLSEFPGRWDGGALWVEAQARASGGAKRAQKFDGVSSVLITSNDFAAAWALDDENRPVMPVVPGGRLQREMAYRVGVNIVMYALTGNYKADQVHVPALLQRLGQ